jgi:K+-transporting ATPase KdpF subunit
MSAKSFKRRHMETAFVSAVAFLLFVYLLVAMLRPEEF